MTSTLRTFVAVELPLITRNELDAFVREFRSLDAAVRWEQTAKLHITLKFLGATEEAQLPAIIRLLKTAVADIAPFPLVLTSTGCFSGRHGPRVVWIGAESPAGALEALATRVDEATRQLGFEPDNKPFHAHVTLARITGRRSVVDLLRTMESRTFRSQPIEVSHIALVKSELRPGGSVYSVLSSIPLSEQQSKKM